MTGSARAQVKRISAHPIFVLFKFWALFRNCNISLAELGIAFLHFAVMTKLVGWEWPTWFFGSLLVGCLTQVNEF